MGLDGRWSKLSGWLTSYPEEMVLRILGFWKDRVKVRSTKRGVGFFGYDEIRSVWTGSEELRS